MKKLTILPFKTKPLATLVALSLGFNASLSVAQENNAEQEAKLETILITAQKRTQNLQEVPVSVAAFSGEQLAEAVIKDVYDLQTNVPGLQALQQQNATQASFYIRGVGTSSQNFGLESSVGLYVDGVFRARQSSIVNNMVDMEAVEVLRGPQGTLFGKNTPSGAILLRTVSPDHDGAEGFVEATIGNMGLVNVSAASSFSAIEDVLAFRATGFSSQRDGYVDIVGVGEDILNDRNRFGGRLQALYTPNDDVSVRVIADYSEIDEKCCGAPTLVTNFSAREVPGVFGSDAALAGLFGHPVTTGEQFFDNKVYLSDVPVSTNKDRGLSAEINWELNDNYSLVAISAYRAFDSFDQGDVDYTQVDLLNVINDAEQSSFSQELRLDYTSDDVNFILGAYYFTQELELDYSLMAGEQFNTYVEQAAFGGGFNELIGGINQLSAATGGLVAPAAQAAPGNSSFDHIASQDHTSYALYGQFDYKLTDTLTLTAGLRFTDEKKELRTDFTEVLAGGQALPTFFNTIGDVDFPETIVPGSLLLGAGTAGAVLQGIGAGQIDITTAEGQVALGALAPFQTAGWAFNPLAPIFAARANIGSEANIDDDQFTYTLKLGYQPDKRTLFYISHGTGYKSGGTNTDRIDAAFKPNFGPETATSYELGMKKDFPDQALRLNVAAHYTTVDDFQANSFTGTAFNLQNAGDIKTYGTEVEMKWLPSDSMELKLSYALTIAEFNTFDQGSCWLSTPFHTGQDDPGRQNPLDGFCSRAGDRVEATPEHYLVGQLRKDFDITDDITAYWLGEVTYSSDIVTDGNNDPLKIQDSYSRVNLRFGLYLHDYDVDVTFWGRNVTDEEIFVTAFDTPLQDGKLNAFTSEPATYGVTIKKHF